MSNYQQSLEDMAGFTIIFMLKTFITHMKVVPIKYKNNGKNTIT